MKKNKQIRIETQFSSIYSVLLLTGLGLLILTLILLIKIYEVTPVNPQNGNLVFIFMIVFAILGFALIVFGLFGAFKLTLQMKRIIPNLVQDASYDRIPSGVTGGLQIIRQKSPTVSEERPKQEVSTTLKPSEEKYVEKKVETDKPKAKEDDAVPPDFSYNDGLQNIVDRYNTEKVRKAFKNWHNTLMITFPDISKSFLFKINGDEGLDFSEGVDNNAAVQVNMDSTVFVKMMTKQINPIKAYSSGNLEVKGEMKNMLKLRKLMF